MRRLIHVLLLGFAASVLALALLRSPDASASAVYSSGYTFDQTFATSVRLLHVDMGFKILEKDKDLGYILFEYTSPESGKRKMNGSIEIAETKTGTNVSVQVPEMPQYHEQMIIDDLVKKLQKDYGPPPSHETDKDKEKDKQPKDKDGEKKPADGDKDKDGEKKPADGDKDKDGADKDKPKDDDGF
jgi:hypothetical protein